MTEYLPRDEKRRGDGRPTPVEWRTPSGSESTSGAGTPSVSTDIKGHKYKSLTILGEGCEN